MDALECIRARRSYRGAFSAAPVPRGDLAKIIEAGLAAPSGCNAQTTSLAGIDDPALVGEIMGLVGKNGFGGGRPPAGVCVLTRRAPAYADVYFNVQDYSAAIENMLLAITALGYASCWIEGQVTESAETQARIAELLKAPAGLAAVAFLPVGVPAEGGGRPSRKPFEERAPFRERGWYNAYGGQA